MKKFIVLTLMIGLLVTMSACYSTSPAEGVPVTPPSETVSQNESQTKVLWDDENVRVTFIELYEEPLISGAAYMRLKVENKSDKTVTVLPKDAYVNDTATLLGSGVHMELAPGKNSQTPFIIFYKNIGVTSIDEIEKVEFKLTFYDENFDMVGETETLVVEFNK